MRTRAEDAMEMERRVNSTAGDDQREKVCDQSYIKQQNIQTVLAMLKQHQPISRTDIARMTGMSPTSITRIVTALLNQGLVYETSGEQRIGRGRKATNLRVSEDGLYSVGIHLERSVIRLCVLNFANEVLYRAETLVDGECTPEKMANEAKALFDRMPEEIIGDRSRIGGVGICLSGAVDQCKGVVTNSFQLNWQNVKLQSLFSQVFGMTACVENDVKACLIGEKVRMGIADGVDTAYILVDQGIGLAATSCGVLVRGVKNEAGEIVYMPIGKKPDGSLDYFGNHLLKGRLLECAQAFDPSIYSIDALLRAQQEGKTWAEALIADFREYLEIAVRMIRCIYSPKKIIIGGSISHRLYPDIAEKTGLDVISLGSQYEESCMTGAGLVAMRKAIVERIGQNVE